MIHPCLCFFLSFIFWSRNVQSKYQNFWWNDKLCPKLLPISYSTLYQVSDIFSGVQSEHHSLSLFTLLHSQCTLISIVHTMQDGDSAQRKLKMVDGNTGDGNIYKCRCTFLLIKYICVKILWSEIQSYWFTQCEIVLDRVFSDTWYFHQCPNLLSYFHSLLPI